MRISRGSRPLRSSLWVGAVVVAAACLTVAPASAAPVPTVINFSFSGLQEAWVVPQGVTSVTVTVAAASGEDAPPPVNTMLPAWGGDGGVVTVTLPVTPGMELLLLVGQHPTDDDPLGGAVVGNRTSGSAYNGGGGSFLATVAEGILVAAGGGGAASRDVNGSNSTNADGGAGGFASSGSPDGAPGGPGALGGGGATTTGPGTQGVGTDSAYQLPAAATAAHVETGLIVPGYGGGFGLNSAGGGGGGYFGGGAGNTDFPQDLGFGSGGGGSGYISDAATMLSTSTNVGHGYLTIEYTPAPTLAETGVNAALLTTAMSILLLLGIGVFAVEGKRPKTKNN